MRVDDSNIANKLLYFMLRPENGTDEGQIERLQWSHFFYGVFANVMTGIFTYENIERSRVRCIERSFFNSTYVVAFNDDSSGVIVAPAMPVGDMNSWGLYSEYDILMPDGRTVRKRADDVVVGYNYNIPTIPDSLLCWQFAELMAELKISIKNGIILSRKTAVMEVDDENMLNEVLTQFNQHTIGAPVIIKKNRKGATSSQVMEFTSPTTVTEYYDNVRDILNEFLTVTGLSSLVNPNKKERLLDSEISSNEDIKNTLLTNRIENREDFIQAINDKFGTDWKVSVDENIISMVEDLSETYGGDKDGSTDDKSGTE